MPGIGRFGHESVRPGIWRVENERVALGPFAALSRSVQRQLEDEAGRLEAFFAD